MMRLTPALCFPHWNPNSLAGTMHTFNILFTEDFLLCADRSHMWRRCQPIRWTCCWWIRLTCWPESRGDPGPDTLRRKGWGQFFGLLWLRVTDWMQKTKWAEAEESCCCPHFRCLYCSTFTPQGGGALLVYNFIDRRNAENETLKK